MFEKNQIYRRRDIHHQYGGQQQGGISTPTENPLIFLWTEPDPNKQDVYVDKWENDYFYYSGQGKIGDMMMTRNNKTIYDHQSNGKEIHLFEKTQQSGMWKYIDQLRLVDINFYRNLDIEGNERESFQFVLLSVSKENTITSNISPITVQSYNYNTPNITERKGLVTSRVGQGIYRKKILDKWDNKCSVTGVGITKILISSHIVPWRDSNDFERQDVNNGLLLSPDLDGLFDRNLISFKNNREIIISKSLNSNDLKLLGINRSMKLRFLDNNMKKYLDRHREKFLENEENFI